MRAFLLALSLLLILGLHSSPRLVAGRILNRRDAGDANQTLDEGDYELAETDDTGAGPSDELDYSNDNESKSQLAKQNSTAEDAKVTEDPNKDVSHRSLARPWWIKKPTAPLTATTNTSNTIQPTNIDNEKTPSGTKPNEDPKPPGSIWPGDETIDQGLDGPNSTTKTDTGSGQNQTTNFLFSDANSTTLTPIDKNNNSTTVNNGNGTTIEAGNATVVVPPTNKNGTDEVTKVVLEDRRNVTVISGREPPPVDDGLILPNIGWRKKLKRKYLKNKFRRKHRRNRRRRKHRRRGRFWRYRYGTMDDYDDEPARIGAGNKQPINGGGDKKDANSTAANNNQTATNPCPVCTWDTLFPKNCNNSQYEFLKDHDNLLAVVKTAKGGFKGRRINELAIRKILASKPVAGNLNQKLLESSPNSPEIKVSANNSYVLPAGHYYFPKPVRVVGFDLL